MNRLYIALVLVVTAQGVYAHDTTHIHPLITERIADLIRDTDTGRRYQDLYIRDGDFYTNWGNDWDTANPPAEIDKVMDDNFPPYAGYATVMAGVVQEDAPATKVRSHFHHALHGTGLKFIGTSTYLGGPSAARSAAMFHFGMALHHVEDMSSPAHVHNDPHLTFLAIES